MLVLAFDLQTLHVTFIFSNIKVYCMLTYIALLCLPFHLSFYTACLVYTLSIKWQA